MKIGIKQGIIIGAVVLIGGGLLLRGAWANPAPQPVPLPAATNQTLTVNPPAGDSVVSPQTYPYQSYGPNQAQGTQGYGGYGMMGGYDGYGGMMGGYGGYGSSGGGGYGGSMGGYGGGGFGGGMM